MLLYQHTEYLQKIVQKTVDPFKPSPLPFRQIAFAKYSKTTHLSIGGSWHGTNSFGTNIHQRTGYICFFCVPCILLIFQYIHVFSGPTQALVAAIWLQAKPVDHKSNRPSDDLEWSRRVSMNWRSLKFTFMEPQPSLDLPRSLSASAGMRA